MTIKKIYCHCGAELETQLTQILGSCYITHKNTVCEDCSRFDCVGKIITYRAAGGKCEFTEIENKG